LPVQVGVLQPTHDSRVSLYGDRAFPSLGIKQEYSTGTDEYVAYVPMGCSQVVEDAPTLGFQFTQGPASPLFARLPRLASSPSGPAATCEQSRTSQRPAGHQACAPAQAAPFGSSQVGDDDQRSKDGSQDEEAAPVSPKPSVGQLLVLPGCALSGLPESPRLLRASQQVADEGAMWSEQ
jgi:hypothetical protein